MYLSSKKIFSGSLASLILAAAPCANAGVGIGVGDFEAKVFVDQDGIPATPVSVSVTIASAATKPTFSGRVVAGGVSQTIAGAFVVDEMGNWTASVRGLKGLPGFDLSYVQPVAAIDDTELSIPDSLSVRVVTGGILGDEINAKPATILLNDDSGAPWELKHAVAGAIQTSPESFAELDQILESVDGKISDLNTQISDLRTGSLPSLTAELKAAETELALVVKAGAAAKAKAAALTTLKAAEEKAEDALDKALMASSALIDKAFITAGVLTAAELAELLQNSESTPGQELLDSVGSAVANQMSDVVTTFTQAVAAFNALLKAVTSATTVDNLDDALSNLGVSSPLDYISFDTDAKRLSATKTFWGVVAAQVAPVTSAYLAVQTAEDKVLSTEETLRNTPFDPKDPSGPSVLDAATAADDSIAQQTDVVAQARASLTMLNDEIAGYEASKASLVSSKAMLTSAKALSGFAGYGTFSGAVTGAKYNSKAPVPVTAVIAGTTPDGQKFTYSAKLRGNPSEDTNGIFHVNTVAGKNPLVLEVGYSVDSSSKTGAPVQQEVNGLFWAGLGGAQVVGSALFPAKVADVDRADNGRAMNIFGGPLDDEGLVSTDTKKASTVVVSFGEAVEGSPITGFGALVSNANKVNGLLVARKGSTFTLTPSVTAAPVFAGVFPYASSTAKPSPYSGVFMRVDGENGSEVKGFGAMVASTTSSVPVEVSSNFTSDVPPPQAPSAPSQPPVVWTGFTGGSLSFVLTDMPEALNITTVILYKGTKEIGRAIASSDGVVQFPTKGLVAGSDYTLKVSRELISGVGTSDPSDAFEVVTKTLPAYTYQTTLGLEGFEPVRNGIPIQGRLTVTTTATGTWSGRLEWVSLTQVRDFEGNLMEGAYIPALKSFTLKGQLATGANPESPSGLSSSVLIPSVKGAPGHNLQFALADYEGGELPTGNFWGATTSLTALSLTAAFTPDASEGEAEGAVFIGSCVPVAKGVVAAKGKFSTASTSGNSGALSNHSHVIDYAGAGVATYTFQNGALGKLISSSNVRMDGTVPVLAVGVVGKYSLPYTNSLNRTVTASMAIPMVVASEVEFSTFVDESGIKPVSRYTVSSDGLYFSGCELEVAAKVAGGHVYRSDWADSKTPKNGFGGWLFSDSSLELVPTKRVADFTSDEKVAAGTTYTLEIMSGAGSNTSSIWSGQVTFDSKGVGTVEEYASLVASKRPVVISVVPTTGVMTATVTVGTVDGSVTVAPATGGKAVKLTGFTLPNSGSLMGWGGIEGGDLSWRLTQ